MSAIGLTYPQVLALRPCSERLQAVAALLGGKEAWNGNVVTAQQARDAGCTYRDLRWIAIAAAKGGEDLARRVRLWAADCAAHVLPIYESRVPDNPVVRKAIKTARRFARGEVSSRARTAARNAVCGAAWRVRDPSARAVAITAFNAVWSELWESVWQTTGHAAKAAGWAHADSAASGFSWRASMDAASRDEEVWQFDRLVAWLSDPEPEDWPLP